MANKANTKIIFVKAEDRFCSLSLRLSLSFPAYTTLSLGWLPLIHSISHEHMKMEMSTEKYQIQNKYEADAYQYTSDIAKSLKRNPNIRVKHTNIGTGSIFTETVTVTYIHLKRTKPHIKAMLFKKCQYLTCTNVDNREKDIKPREKKANEKEKKKCR